MAAPVAPASRSKGFLQRELNGASFLTLEHIGHMALVVVVSGLILAGLQAALSMWFGGAGTVSAIMGGPGNAAMAGAGVRALEAAMSLCVVAALTVLAPLLFLLDRRTRAEWHKRPGFAARLAYKVPVYTALGVLATLLTICKIQMLYVLLTSLALIGVPGAPIGDMYVHYFIPALLGAAVFTAAGWYVFLLAKGRDHGRRFSIVASIFAAVVAVALFITTVVVLHDGSSSFTPAETNPTPLPLNGDDYYRDLMHKYYQ